MKRKSAVLLSAALVLGAIPGMTAPQVTIAQERTVTLVGDLQSELGCPGDWQPECAGTRLADPDADGRYEGVFDVPAGDWKFKVALDGTWDEAYPAADVPLSIEGPASLAFTFDLGTQAVGVAPTALPGPATEADAALAGDSLREALTAEQFYFVLADRFANGDTGNDRGGIDGDRMAHGFDPTDKGFYHGGDLQGIMDRLDYIEGLGTTSIWLTPSFKNRPVQGSGDDISAGYHGYWITDFTQIDPHLGTNEEMKALVDAAHARGMKVFFDIITNHTADVIDYAEGEYSYISKEAEPYRDASGNAFDDRDYVGGTFPAMDASSFPYTPTFRTDADRTVKVPEWLNDVTMYHNRGNSTWAGESSTYGDFIGLDDLFTERAEVVDGMIDIYSTWADFGIDGFRIDTVKHVNLEFWQEFSPRVLEAARAGNADFFMFGEVFDGNPQYVSTFTTEGTLQSALDFPFQGRSIDFASGGATVQLRDLFAQDDYYTDADSNAYQLATFTGNHDMGRAAMMLAGKGYTGDELQRRVELANELMFLTRGHPVVYYGDEQGFIGAGGDKDARQDMFATQVGQYAGEAVVGAPSGSRDRYDTSHPLYRQIAELAALREAHPALVDGAQLHRYASNDAGVYAFSRIAEGENVEYLVVTNNASASRQTSIPTFGGTFESIHGDGGTLTAGSDGRLGVTVPALSTVVWRATAPLAERSDAPAVSIASPSAGGVVGGRAEIAASVPEADFAQVTFLWRPTGTSDWRTLGTDDNAPYRVFHDVTDLDFGTLVEYRAVLKDSSGNISASSSYGIVGEATSGGGGVDPVGPVEQPDAVSVPGSHNTEMGCPGDWQPDCAEAQLSLDAKDSIWKRTYDALPAGDYEYKAAINNAWDENYGAGGVRDGGNIAYTATGQPVTFYYEHARHYVTSDAEGPIITAPGSMQSELGCPGDWDPSCMAPWLIDPDGDGVYTWSATAVPAGNYELKVAHGLSWAENYGAGGARDGANVAFSVPRDGIQVTISYRIDTHEITVTTSEAGVAPDLTAAKAHWLTPDVIAWPRETGAESDSYRLHWASEGGLVVDAEDVAGGSTAALTVDPAGLPQDLREQYPHLANYLALRVDPATAALAPEILTGQVAVGRYSSTGSVRDATGVQIPGVLDALYAEAAADLPLGVTYGNSQTLRLWAPTAKDVALLVWPEAGAGEPERIPMTRDDASGTWGVTGEWDGREYLYEVEVFVPSTGAVETNRVTDPYSVGLTLNSTRSVIIDLADAELMPDGWATSSGPRLDSPVDQTIYELHVRDFSIHDETVPEELRGSYLAFGADGDGSRHLAELAEAGLNTVHLLPTFDIASIEEDPALQTTPDCDLESYAPDSEEQQRCVMAQADTDAFNWGYDPWHFMTPEGSYTSTAEAAHGGERTLEFREMVSAIHDLDLRVVLDQVYNHTAASGQSEKSVLDRVVPGYYHRLNATGAVETSTCCENVATEHAMAEKLMVDSVVKWARDYRVDGFRFDLMGHHSVENMQAVRDALNELTVADDGVDGTQVTLYGEGWDFGEVAGNARFLQAKQGQLDGTHIATFNDRLRDGVRGGGPFDQDLRTDKGFASGGESANDLDLVQVGLAGNLRDFELRSQETGELTTGAGISYNGAPAGYASHPDEIVNYVDAHDNETLFDILTFKLPADMPMADKVRLNTLGLSTTALSQSVSFWHAGADMLRSKSLDRDSYNSGDWFNLLDWSMTENGFGRGLPPEGKNGDKWDIMRPLLADAALKPAPEDIEQASAMAQDLLELRFSTELFRLGDPDLIREKLSFPVSGTELGDNQVIVMHIDDTVGGDVDEDLERVVVVFNASAEPISQQVPGLEGHELELSEVQREGADEVVKTATWDRATGTADVPAYTVAVFVQGGDEVIEPTPTPTPSVTPSPTPTGKPTAVPSGKPTAVPSGKPTSSPTIWPTERPRPGLPRTGV
ncbi:pullulanase-type alpha-1,6-glucosidase [Tessaracoccus oleiagri]|uniref:Alpha-1,6-glucosidases, pullulanase-type n=1 Tax=Tessaracoccus oleiagri TaxID=686624 RepID=A0A1G9KPW9_9ACTN|nr:pullulanase-type alpha-1,6-glucosidase [Tessaracoccus oleiagri]SDL51742.1 alpha-1,6-glucosidases, pullulanase-type [Tessaracoccus oleiagri]